MQEWLSVKSKFFSHPITRLVVAAMLTWSFLAIFIVVGVGSGQIWNLVSVGIRHDWWRPQTLAWIGLGLEIGATMLIATRFWPKIAVCSGTALLFSALLFLFRSQDFEYLSYPKINGPILIFAGCLLLRAIQLRARAPQKPAATKPAEPIRPSTAPVAEISQPGPL